jgi:hypothetical protein
MAQRILVYFVFFLSGLFLLLLYRNRTSPKVLETCLMIAVGAMTLFALRLEPEKHDTKFDFVYFFDWERGEYIDLKTPVNYFLEDRFLPFCQDVLKAKLKNDFILVARDLTEYVVLKWLDMTPFGFDEYTPTSRLVHLGSISYGGYKGAPAEKEAKSISEEQLKGITHTNIFSGILNNPSFPHFSLKEIKIPSGARFDVVRSADNKIAFTMEKTLWFELNINVTIQGGGIVANKKWAEQYLNLEKDSISRLRENKIYECDGQIEIKWELKRWSIGNPDIGLYRQWLLAVTGRLQEYFNWDHKCQILHIEDLPDRGRMN